ncbi:MAG: ammonia channel protein, partial [Methylocystis sp.]
MSLPLPRGLSKAAICAGALILSLGAPSAFAGNAPVPNPGDTAWMLTSSALVLMMSIPGLALFYGGLVRSKN